MKILAERLREARQTQKRTQKNVADFLGVIPLTYQRYELSTHIPDVKTLVKLADYFNVSADYLLGRTDKPN